MATPLKDIINRGEITEIPAVARAAQLGEVLHAGGVRTQREVLPVASAAATPTYTVLQLLYAKTIGTGAPAVKAPQINGATPSAGQAAPNAGGTSIAFHAETTGTGTVEVVYLTTDAPKDADGNVAKKLSETAEGLY
jgi:hypothetical protein